ncbi:MAG: hypothetical protein QOG73_1451, partial [Acetobacteraceae bacterium]|nr:hypothetical protein [Acetobacteraceae bacterium]
PAVRGESCLECHIPANKAGSDRLVLLQTPLHAAGEIDNVIAAVKSAEMPEDDIGLRKDIPASDRAALLADAMAFRDEPSGQTNGRPITHAESFSFSLISN